MAPSLPRDLVQADAALHALYQRVAFSKYLNPTNGGEAWRAFLDGRPTPPFVYQPADWADEALAELDRMRPPRDHPLGALVADAVEGTRVFTLAMRDRSPEAFHRMATEAGWYPDAATVAAARAERAEEDDAPFVLNAHQLVLRLTEALQSRNLVGWRVDLDPVMSARVLVDGAKRLLRVSPRARFRERDVPRLVAHEVEVHALRSAAGDRQPLKVFATGLPGSLETEEGLAMVAEELVGAASPGTGWRQGLVVRAVPWARDATFRELYDRIMAEGSPGLAWGIALRLKRGLADPDAPAVYAKDVVYYRGLRRVREWLAAGGQVEHLYVGKVGVTDPVAQWLAEGWILPGEVPSLFRDLRAPAGA